MIKRFLTTCLILLPVAVAAQSSCCQLGAEPSAEVQFASLANDANFRSMHSLPLPFRLDNPKGSMVKFKTTDGTDGNAYLIKASKKTDKWLLVFQEWWGLNDYVKQEAERLHAALDVNVIAIDMYDGKLATTREDAGKYMQSLSPERSGALIQGAINYTGKNTKIATIGWCMGGGLSQRASLAAGKQGVACVIYYGQPETDPAKLASLNAPVLMIWPTQDKWINAELVDKFKAGMQQAGKKLTVEAYDADHAFANPSNPKHNTQLTADANGKALAFLKENLK